MLQIKVLWDQNATNIEIMDYYLLQCVDTRKVSGVRQEATGNQSSNQQAAREARFIRSSSMSEVDVSEASFSDMLKSNNARKTSPTPTPTPADLNSDQSRRGKKKGKKGKQIDPALLGFKVTSNRIMMGEIQRIED